MNTELATKPTNTFSHAQFYSLVSAYSGSGRPADDAPPRPPGPWDPVIRTAVRDWLIAIAARHDARLYEILHPHVPVGLHDRLSLVALNPQPLPPGRRALIAGLAEKVISRAEMLMEFASAATSDAEKRGIIIVSGYVGRFVRDFTQPDFHVALGDTVQFEIDHDLCPPPRYWLLPDFGFSDVPVVKPPPLEHPDWAVLRFDAGDYLHFGETFAAIAKRTADQDLRRVFDTAAGQFLDAAAGRLK